MSADRDAANIPEPRELTAAETAWIDGMLHNLLVTGVDIDDLRDYIGNSLEMWEVELGLRP